MNLTTQTLAIAAVASCVGAAHAASAPFTETYDGGVFTIDTPIVETGSNAVLTLANDALSVTVPGSTRTAITLEVPDATPVPGLKVTQSIDFNINAVIGSVSRLGFVFAANPPETAGEGPADALYAYIREPSGGFAPTEWEIVGLDETTGFIDGDPNDGSDALASLAQNTDYSLVASATFFDTEVVQVDVELFDTVGSLGTYSYTIQDIDDDEDPINGSYYGLYVRNFDAASEIIFDDWSVTADNIADFNDDGTLDQADIDLLLDNIGDPAFDITGDAVTDTADTDQLILNYLNSFFADANLDGAVDTSDLAILAANFDTSVPGWAQADFNGDGFVDTSDLAILAANFGSGTPALATAAVPEPASLALIIGAAPALLRRRR
ncbi:MAG: dockerin type I domain-containing protein [Planctomycetota bacterium]